MRTRILLLAGCALTALCGTARAELKLPALFGDNMVLQGGQPVPVWGWAEPGETVTVSFASQSVAATADGKGHWQAMLDLSHPPAGPGTMTITGSKTAAPHTIRNVAVGEVWLAAGQSNMEKPLGPHTGQHPVDRWEQEVADSSNPQIRVFTVTPKASAQPLDDCQGKWEVASPQTTARFTATGYFFAREINREFHTPVGIIHSSWGGTRIEAWTSAQGLAADPVLAPLAKQEVQAFDEYPRGLARYHAAIVEWAAAHGCGQGGSAGEKSGWAAPNLPADDWQPIQMGSGKKGSIAPGIHWYRKTVNIPSEWKDRAAYLSLGTVGGFETAYFNGVRVGGTDANTAERAAAARMYLVPAGAVQPGPATVALRVVSYLPEDAPVTEAYRMALTCVGNVGLGGPWLTRAEALFPTPDASAVAAYPAAPPGVRQFDVAGFLFNGMIRPLIPYRLAGALWYQGESNAWVAPWVLALHPDSPAYQGPHPDPAALYLRSLPALINDWRSQWAQGGAAEAFPFYYCQLPNYGKKGAQPAESAWAEVREAQRRTLAAVPNVGMAVLIDVGQAKDIHPTNKEEVGRRLALLALARTYGRTLEASGPLYQSMAVEGDRIRIRFTHAGDALVARPLPEAYQPQSYNPATEPLVKPRPGSPLQGFEIRGEDGRWAWADATIDGQTVLVSSPGVHGPVAVRYAWADNPTCNLYNAAGLPASPFRTDDWAK